MSGSYTEAEAETIRAFVRARQRQKRSYLAARLDAARRDCDAIVSAIAREHKPLRVYQWESLVNDRHFSEMSEIDIAVEGITDPAALSALRAAAESIRGLVVL